MKELEREIERLLDSNLHYQNDLKKDASMIATYISERDKRIVDEVSEKLCDNYFCNRHGLEEIKIEVWKCLKSVDKLTEEK